MVERNDNADNIEVICIGAAIVDIPLQPVSRNILDANSHPLERIAMITGGDAINETTIISHLGHRTALMGRISNDAAGYFIVDHCHRGDIDIKGLKQDADINTSINVGLATADGERTLVASRNGSLWKLNMNDVDFDRLSQAKLLSLAGILNNPLLGGDVLTAILTQAKAHKLVVYVDIIKPQLNEMLDDIREALSYMNHLFPNFEEAKLLTGRDTLDEITDSFLNCGMETVVVKTGKGGCFIRHVDIRMVVPAVSGIAAIDTIGAGDNFASGFVSAPLESKPFRDCTLFVDATAAISVLSVDATTGVKNRKLVEQLLDEYEG